MLVIGWSTSVANGSCFDPADIKNIYLKKAMTEQKNIGWDQIMHGRISSEFEAHQDSYLEYNGSADVTVHVIVDQRWVKVEENPSANGRERGTRIYIFSSGESQLGDCLGEIVIFLRTILCSHRRETRETHFFEPYLFSPTKQQPTNENSSKDTGTTTINTILSLRHRHYGHEYYTSVFLSVC